MSKIKIATDSTSDLPKELAEQWNITVLPLTIIAGDKQYRDGCDLTTEEFYELLERSDKLPTTSQLPPYAYADLFEQTWRDGYTDLIQICINAKGSATWQSAVQARNNFFEEHPEAKGQYEIHVIDSRTYSMAYGMAVLQAGRLAAQGASLDEILAAIHEWLDHARPMFVPLTLRYVKKSGRVSAAAAFVGEALGLKPAITFENGESKVVTKIRGEQRAVAGLMEIVKRERKPGTPYVLVYGNNPEQAEKLRQACREQLDQPPEFEYPVGCIISINTGPNMIALIYRT